MSKLLYHYCSINTLELIMKNKTFKFSSLGIVDDMEEAMTSDYDDIGRICFVSCWTDLEQESVDMWRTYTGGIDGVRIGLPENFFQIGFKNDEFLKEIQKIMKDNDLQISPPYYPQLLPVTYTNDDELINIKVLNNNNSICDRCSAETVEKTINTDYLGRFKRSLWSGQSEWRYRLIAIPQEYYRNNNEGKYLKNNVQESIEQMTADLSSMAFQNNFMFIQFHESVFQNMEIVLSPLNSNEHNEKVRFILNEYAVNHKVNVKESTIKIRKKL